MASVERRIRSRRLRVRCRASKSRHGLHVLRSSGGFLGSNSRRFGHFALCSTRPVTMPLVWKQFGSAHAASVQLKACTNRPTGGMPGRKGVDRRCCESGWVMSVSGLPRTGFLPAAAGAAAVGAVVVAVAAGFICDAAAASPRQHDRTSFGHAGRVPGPPSRARHASHALGEGALLICDACGVVCGRR